MSKERRRFFRIDDIVSLKTEVIDPRHVDQRLSDFRTNRHQFSALNEFNFQLEQHQADLKRIKEKMPELGRYLEVLHKQLDYVTERVLKDDDFVDTQLAVNLSAQGISFFSDEMVRQDDIVELHLKLMPEHHKIVIFARVIDCQKADASEGRYKISLDFEHIHDADRELLIKHVHGQQLKALGAARFGRDKS